MCHTRKDKSMFWLFHVLMQYDFSFFFPFLNKSVVID